MLIGGSRNEATGATVYATYRQHWQEGYSKSITPATRKALDKAWGTWITWCRLAEEEVTDLSPFAPPLDVYCSFIYFYLSLYKPDTVKKYLTRINTAAKEITGHPINKHLSKLCIDRTFIAAARRMGHGGTKTRLPLTADILAKLHPLIRFELHDDRALWAILCVGVFALARIGELVPGNGSKLQVTLGSVSIIGDRGVISLVGTKTDRERKGVKLFFFRSWKVHCPVTAMVAYLSGRAGASRASPLFVNSRGEKFTQSWVVGRLRRLLDRIGLEGKNFSGISLRRGGTQTLVRLRANDTIIMGMGRWTSSCFNRYVSVMETDVRQWQMAMASV